MTASPVSDVSVPTAFGTLAGAVFDARVHRRRALADLVVVWPSVLSTARVQRGLVSLLAADHVVLAVDPPGHGSSRIERASQLSNAACAEATWDLIDAAAVGLDARQAPTVRWVGTSWGGLVGLEASLSSPARVSHLSCLNTPFAFTAPPALRPAALPLLARGLGTSPLFAAMTARSFFLPRTRRDPSKRAAMAAHRATFTDGDRQQLAAALRLLFVDREDATAQLGQVDVPTLVIAGAHDPMYSPAAQRESADRLPRGWFEVVDSAHIAAVDATAEVAEHLTRSWSRAERSRPR